MTGVDSCGDLVRSQWRIETGPAGSGLKFRVGTEQLTSACGAEVNSLLMIVPIQVFVWSLCLGLAQNLKLYGSQNLSPLILTQQNFLANWRRVELPADSSGFCLFRQAEANRQNKNYRQQQTLHSLSTMNDYRSLRPSFLSFGSTICCT